MVEFSTSLVREKIIFDDRSRVIPDVIDDDFDLTQFEPETVRSNRIDLKLIKGDEIEHVIVRAQNMHSTLRMAAKVFTNFYKGGGAFEKRAKMPNWEAMWKQSLSVYEQEYNAENNWCAIYMKGASVFKTKDDHFMDIVEQCALASKGDYDNTKEVAEYALKKIGKDIRITHHNNVAAVISDKPDGLRCGIMHRSERKDTIFNFMMEGGAARTDRIHHAFIVAASFLEGINLGHVVKYWRDQLVQEKITKGSDEAKLMRDSQKRQLILLREINAIEDIYKFNYRPEKPDFMASVV